MRSQPPVHPFGPVLLALLAVAIVGALYGLFGVGKDALLFAVSALIAFAMPVVAIFGIAGVVIAIRRLLGRMRRS
jgi:hypothetical protein